MLNDSIKDAIVAYNHKLLSFSTAGAGHSLTVEDASSDVEELTEA